MAEQRYLVVDDDDADAVALTKALRPLGTVSVAASAASAKALLAHGFGWSGLVVDMGLPDGSGLDVADAALAMANRPRIMLLTGGCAPELANGAQDLHVSLFFKPLAPRRIREFFSNDPVRSKIEGALPAWHRRYRLTSTEVDVLRHAALGQPLADIASARGSTHGTVKRHSANLLAKTGDDTLQFAAARLLRETLAN